MTEQLAVYSDQRRLGSITFDGHDDKYSLLYDAEWLEKLPSTTLHRDLGRNAKIVRGRCPGQITGFNQARWRNGVR